MIIMINFLNATATDVVPDNTYFWDSVWSIVIAVISGVVVFLIGQVFQTIWLTPLQNYKNIKSKIAAGLSFYARDYSNIIDLSKVDENTRKRYSEISDELRNLSCELTGYIETLSWFKIGIPSKKDLNKASKLLMFLSNKLHTPYGKDPDISDNIFNIEKANEIRKLLKIYIEK